LRTKANIAIGSIFAMDDVPHEPISDDGKRFLNAMANNCMAHLESTKEREDRKRMTNMNSGLAAFVDPDHQVQRKRQLDEEGAYSAPGSERARSPDDAKTPFNPLKRLQRKFSTRTASELTPTDPAGAFSPREAERNDDSDEDPQAPMRVGEDDRFHTFKRAADLLRQALSLNGGGGVVFLDTVSSFRPQSGNATDAGSVESSDTEHSKSDIFARRSSLADANLAIRTARRRGDSTSGTQQRKWTGLLGFSVKQPKTHAPGFTPVSSAHITKLVKKYPRGKLFTFGINGMPDSGSSGEESAVGGFYDLPNPKTTTPSRSEGAMLLKARCATPFLNARHD